MVDELGPRFGADDWELLNRETPFSGFFRLDRITLRHRLYDGGWSAPLTRELFVRTRAVAVVPYDSRRREILLVEQFRVGAIERRVTPWCLELIAGICDRDGESLDQVARREAGEEAGLELGRMRPLYDYMASPGGSNERLQLFVAEADLENAGGIFGHPEENEDIRALTVAVHDLPAVLESGWVDNAPVLIALQWLLLHEDELRREWCK